MSLGEFLSAMLQNPPLLLTSLLTAAVILVNGWTDAPNAIATCVSTRALSPRAAILMAAAGNLLGILVMTFFNRTVAETICSMVDFSGDARGALTALCAAMVAIVVWAVLAFLFGIPTSESHALIAGLSGAAVALQGGPAGIRLDAWAKVLWGLLLSALLGLVLGYLCARLTEELCRNRDRRKTAPFFRGAQVFGGAAMAFMHGAQDGQKFLGVFLLGIALCRGQADVNLFQIPLWLMVLTALLMALGTSLGGARIIRAVGMDMVRLTQYQGFAADLAGALCLLLASLTGMPVSTTHVKTTAIMGVGAAKSPRRVHWGVAGEMALTWVLTFPGCGLIGYFMARLFLRAF